MIAMTIMVVFMSSCGTTEKVSEQPKTIKQILEEAGALDPIQTTYYAYQFQTICIASNYRGCGKSEGKDEFGGADVDDVIHFVDFCGKLSFVDPQKINMLGVSRGGMMTYEVLRNDNRVHKAVVVSGLADSFMGYEERDDMREIYKELVGGTPENYQKSMKNVLQHIGRMK